MAKRKPSTRLLVKAADELYRATEQAVLLSERSRDYFHTGRQVRVMAVFTKLIAHNMSLMLIARKFIDVDTQDADGVLDHFSIATLGRACVDAALMTMYLSEPSLSRDAWDFRRQLLFLHDLDNRSRFLKPMKKQGVQIPFFENNKEIREGIQKRIRELAPTLGYSPEQIEEFANGRHLFVSGVRGAVREADWGLQHFEMVQSYFSAYVHSHPVSFMKIEEHGVKFEGASRFQIGLCSFVSKAVTSYTVSAVKRMKTFGVPMAGDPVGQLD